jgi:hypothetical protein
MSFGFDEVSKPAGKEARKLDLSGLKMPAPIPPTEKEKRALAKGESLGFTAREAQPRGQGRRVERRRQQTATRNLFIKGPEEVLDRFITFTNELGVDAYWQALEVLLNQQKDRK